MTNTLTTDVDSTIKQINELTEAGADIVRVSCPDQDSSLALKKILKHVDIPIVADIHFHYNRAIEAANEIFELINSNHTDIQNEYFKNRVERTNLINKRSKFNFYGFHISNPLLKILRNEFLKRLVKNKNFIHSYLGKIYK